MNFSITIPPGQLASFESSLREKVEAARQPVQSAMADAMHGIVLANFGSTGFMRPWDWQALSPAYARKVGRTFATLFVTGALKDTVRKDASGDSASVSMANNGLVSYALAHHHGNPGNFGTTQAGSGELPARRVFPLDEADQVLPEAVEMVTEAARKAAQEALR